jgi:hypothetical protein
MQCDDCKWQTRVRVKGVARRACLRHRRDGAVHLLPREWMEMLQRKEVRCDLFSPCDLREAA